MANEVTVRTELQIKKDGVDYRSHPNNHRVTLVGTANGPTPGSIAVSVAGVDVDLTQLTTPGMCRLQNLDVTNFVEYGIWDGVEFIPLGEVGPLEQYVIKLSRRLGNSYGIGTGTTDSGNRLRLKADTAACKCVVEAFER
jgi:hypothetical protein